MTTKEQYFEQFKKETTSNDVVVYMKGSQKMPQCGFSAAVVAVFQNLGVPFHDVNVLADEGVRTYLKEFSDWPTFPQIFVKGELVGGCDIVREMHASGELQQLLKEKGIAA
jgi:monothiol glutaredoxin